MEEEEEDIMAMVVVEEVEEDMANLFAAEKGVLRKQIACTKNYSSSRPFFGPPLYTA